MINLIEDYIEYFLDPELGYDADTERLHNLHDAFEKRIKLDESEFSMKVWSFYRWFALRGNWASPEMSMKNLRLNKKILRELGRLIQLFHRDYPGNEYYWGRKEFNAELCADALVNFIKEHESELSSEFINRARLELESIKKHQPKVVPPPRTKEEAAEREKAFQKFMEELRRDKIETERKIKLQEEREKEYAAKHNSETALQRFKTILYATIRIYF